MGKRWRHRRRHQNVRHNHHHHNHPPGHPYSHSHGPAHSGGGSNHKNFHKRQNKTNKHKQYGKESFHQTSSPQHFHFKEKKTGQPISQKPTSTPKKVPPPARVSDSLENGSLVSRKRSLAQVQFVYPKVNGSKEPYHFGKLTNGTKSVEHSERTDVAKEDNRSPGMAKSLDEILNSSTSRKVSGESPLITENAKRNRADSFDEDRPSTISEGQLSGRSVEDAVRDRVGCRPRSNSTDGELNLPQRGLCDEKLVLEAFCWRLDGVNGIGSGKPKGFSNLGNTCYLNSTIQCLAYIPPFCQSLLTMSINGQTEQGGNSALPAGKRITMMMKALCSRVHRPASENMAQSIAPRKLVHAVPTLSKIGSRGGYQFRPGRQEDSHEFLVHLLDAMNDGELREAGINQHKSGWRDRLPVPRLDETTFVHRTFGGYFRSQIRCTRCQYKSNTYDPFMDLSLEVSKSSCNSVMDALRDFTRKETLDNENKWKCSGCKKHVCATKQLTVFRPPLVLCLQLKRFAFSGGFGGFRGFGSLGGFGGFGGGKKISKPIDFPPVLKLPLSDGRSCQYALTGIVIHLGGSATSGHYTACVKKPRKDGRYSWFHMDDSFVEPIPESEVLRQKDAYILFYCRTEVKIEFPSPPLRGSMSAAEAKELGRIRSLQKEQNKVGAQPEMDTDVIAEPESLVAQANSNRVDEATETTNKGAKLVDEPSLSESDGLIQADPGSNTASRLATEGEKKTKDLQHEVSKVSTSAITDDKNDARTTKSVELREEDVGMKGPQLDVSVVLRNGESKQQKSSSEDEESSESSDSEGEDKSQTRTTPNTTSASSRGDPKGHSDKAPRQMVTQDRGDGKGKVSVVLGTSKGRHWSPGTKKPAFQDHSYDLLGNVAVDKWGDATDDNNVAATAATNGDSHRASILESERKKEKARKKRSYLDGWDAALDRGRTKKVKNDAASSFLPTESQKNRFQKIQASVQRMQRGRGKGFRGFSSKKPARPKKSRW